MIASAQDLARHGKYDEAIAILDDVQRRFEGTDSAKGARKLVVLYRGLRDAEMKEDRRRAREELTALGRALFKYHDRSGRYPATLQDLPSRETLPMVDPWGSDYIYLPSPDRRRYRLECRGRDAAPGGTGDDLDLKLVNGDFVVDLPWGDK